MPVHPKFKNISSPASSVEKCSLHIGLAKVQKQPYFCVYNDLPLAVDKGNEAVLIWLDYSAAFDTINHDVFLQQLVQRFGINGSVLDCFSSYFKDCSQSIVINNSVSKLHTLLEGVPQGSVIRPLSFTMYTSPLEDIIASNGFKKKEKKKKRKCGKM